jgi:hypothetical protein
MTSAHLGTRLARSSGRIPGIQRLYERRQITWHRILVFDCSKFRLALFKLDG